MHNVETRKETKRAEKCSKKKLAICLQGRWRQKSNKHISVKIQNTAYRNRQPLAPCGTKKGIVKMETEIAATRPRQLIKKLRQFKEMSQNGLWMQSTCLGNCSPSVEAKKWDKKAQNDSAAMLTAKRKGDKKMAPINKVDRTWQHGRQCVGKKW